MSDSSTSFSSFLSLLQQGQKTGVEYGKVLERLTSGLRINRASDDATGLAAATRLKNDGAIFRRGKEAADRATTFLQVAQDATDALDSVITSMREIAVSAQSYSLSTAQRASAQTEIDSLSAEYTRIVASTKFNDEQVFSSSKTSISAQAGPSRDDIITAQLQTTATEVYGDGTFGAVTTLTTTSVDLYDIQAGDFNGDGNQDLIYTNRLAAGTRGIGIRIGNGDGTFQTAVSLITPAGGVFTVGTGDINGDGKLDIVGALLGTPGKLISLLGNGNGTFQATISYALGDANSNVSVGDINNDGYADVVASAQGASDYLRVYYGNGSGTLTLGTTIATLNDPTNATLVDLNGDGYLDIAEASGTISVDRTLGIRLSNGNGTFGARVSYTGSNGGGASSSGDVNGDGYADILVSNTVGGGFRVYLNNGDGSVTVGNFYTTSGANEAQFSSLLDLNNDGNLDVVTNNVSSATVTVNLGNGNGTFGAARSYAVGGTAAPVRVADFNNDGVSDFVTGVVGGTTLQLRFGTAVSSVRTVKVGSSLSAVSVLTRGSAIVADTYLSRVQSDVSVVSGLAHDGETAFSGASYRAGRVGETLKYGADKILDIDAAFELAKQVRLSLLLSRQQGILASANLTQPRVDELLRVNP